MFLLSGIILPSLPPSLPPYLQLVPHAVSLQLGLPKVQALPTVIHADLDLTLLDSGDDELLDLSERDLEALQQGLEVGHLHGVVDT